MDRAHLRAALIGDEAVDLVAPHMVLSWSRDEAIVRARSKDGLARLGGHTARFARLGGVPATLRGDDGKTAMARGAGTWGTITPTYRRHAGLMKLHVDACAPRQPQRKGEVERRVRRPARRDRDPHGRGFRDPAELQAWTDTRLASRAVERRRPATGTSVAGARAEERRPLTPVPETAPEPFDLAVARVVGRDGLVALEGHRYGVPFRFVGERVEVRGIAGAAVQVLKDGAVVALQPRGADRRLVIDRRHYDGPSTDRVLAPPPLGRMGGRIQRLAAMPAARRSIETSTPRWRR